MWQLGVGLCPHTKQRHKFFFNGRPPEGPLRATKFFLQRGGLWRLPIYSRKDTGVEMVTFDLGAGIPVTYFLNASGLYRCGARSCSNGWTCDLISLLEGEAVLVVAVATPVDCPLGQGQPKRVDSGPHAL